MAVRKWGDPPAQTRTAAHRVAKKSDSSTRWSRDSFAAFEKVLLGGSSTGAQARPRPKSPSWVLTHQCRFDDGGTLPRDRRHTEHVTTPHASARAPG
jgi:hypothetical protein